MKDLAVCMQMFTHRLDHTEYFEALRGGLGTSMVRRRGIKNDNTTRMRFEVWRERRSGKVSLCIRWDQEILWPCRDRTVSKDSIKSCRKKNSTDLARTSHRPANDNQWGAGIGKFHSFREKSSRSHEGKVWFSIDALLRKSKTICSMKINHAYLSKEDWGNDRHFEACGSAEIIEKKDIILSGLGTACKLKRKETKRKYGRWGFRIRSIRSITFSVNSSSRRECSRPGSPWIPAINQWW